MNVNNKLKDRRLELGLTLEEVGTIVGVGKSTVRKWETGAIENMKRDKIALLAKALKVSPAFIMGLEDSNPIDEKSEKYSPALTEKDEKDIAKKLESTLDQLENCQDGLMFDGEPLDEETKELLRISLENSIRLSKQIAKQKYTPKKYR